MFRCERCIVGTVLRPKSGLQQAVVDTVGGESNDTADFDNFVDGIELGRALINPIFVSLGLVWGKGGDGNPIGLNESDQSEQEIDVPAPFAGRERLASGHRAQSARQDVWSDRDCVGGWPAGRRVEQSALSATISDPRWVECLWEGEVGEPCVGGQLWAGTSGVAGFEPAPRGEFEWGRAQTVGQFGVSVFLDACQLRHCGVLRLTDTGRHSVLHGLESRREATFGLGVFAPARRGCRAQKSHPCCRRPVIHMV